MRRPAAAVQIGFEPGRGLSRSPASRARAKRSRHWLALPIENPTVRAIRRVESRSAASGTTRARLASRCSVLAERTMPSSTARSAAVNSIGVASWMFIQYVNHASPSGDSRYEAACF
jgi:hypothetical protein